MDRPLQILRRRSADRLTEALADVDHSLALLEVDDLLCAVLDLSREQLLIDFNYVLSESQMSRFESLLLRRSAGEPLAYVLGEKEFYSLTFMVTPDTLIPRPETELLVEYALNVLEGIGDSVHIIDVGTGSGAIVLSVAAALAKRRSAAQFEAVRFTAIDISGAALEVAKENARRLGLEARVEFVCGNLLEGISAEVSPEKIPVILSNPPYIPEGEQLPRSVRDYEPASALFSGPQGLNCIRDLLAAAKPWLSRQPHSRLLFELGYGQQLLVDSLIRKMGFEEFKFYKDLQGVTRVAEVACQKSFA